ncbi:MAG: metallophosphoesterase [Methanothrix sp.]|nr:metallophosphoesterase [Methanothrix sp.]
MIRILALADTHIEREPLPDALAGLARGADIILHAGDFVSCSAYEAVEALGSLEAVQGNADTTRLVKALPERRTLEVEGIRIGLVHRAGPGILGAMMMAREMDVQVLVFGHIHRPIVERGERLLISPGSPTAPRMAPPSVAELSIHDGCVRGRIIQLGPPTCDYLRYAGSLMVDRE